MSSVKRKRTDEGKSGASKKNREEGFLQLLLRRTNERAEELEEKIKEIRRMKRKRDAEPSEHALRHAIFELDLELENYKVDQKRVSSEIDYLDYSLRSQVREIETVEEEIPKLNSKLAKFESTVAMVDKEGMIGLFGPHAIKLKKVVGEHFRTGSFSKMPRGPLGVHIKLHDREWAPVLESLIGLDTLRMYLVNTAEDATVMRMLMSDVEANDWPIPRVRVEEFNTDNVDIHEIQVHEKGMPHVLDMFTVDDDVALSHLIYRLRSETTMLVDPPSAGKELMMYTERVPKNCSRILLKNGDEIFGEPCFRYYSSDEDPVAEVLFESVEEAKE